MSVEAFFSKPEEFRGTFKEKRRQFPQLSPIGIVAKEMGERAGSELGSFVHWYASQYQNRAGIVEIDEHFYTQVFKDHGIAAGAIFLAGSLQTIEDVLVTGEYHPQDHFDYTNKYVSGYPMFHIGGGSAEEGRKIPYKTLRDLWQISREDPTLAGIFSPENEAMLSFIRFPLWSNMLTTIRGATPQYKQFVQQYAASPQPNSRFGERFTEKQKKFLSENSRIFDNLNQAIDLAKSRVQ